MCFIDLRDKKKLSPSFKIAIRKLFVKPTLELFELFDLFQEKSFYIKNHPRFNLPKFRSTED